LSSFTFVSRASLSFSPPQQGDDETAAISSNDLRPSTQRFPIKGRSRVPNQGPIKGSRSRADQGFSIVDPAGDIRLITITSDLPSHSSRTCAVFSRSTCDLNPFLRVTLNATHIRFLLRFCLVVCSSVSSLSSSSTAFPCALS